jgi:alpha-tubulin suppressor-like RCC1 family protein
LIDLLIDDACLGFSHTLAIEKHSGRLIAFGDNSKGQADGIGNATVVCDPTTPSFLNGVRVASAATGLFHSAVVTADGALITFGCGRVGQSLPPAQEVDGASFGRWSPDDGSKVVKVSCGRSHTLALDDRGRVWSFGDNKYGQLGRLLPSDQKHDAAPGLVQIPNGCQVYDVQSGWSHAFALCKDESSSVLAYGWGRNDKGQLGSGSQGHVALPTPVFADRDIRSLSCGSEFTVIVDVADALWGCGWNEHGNLATGRTEDCLQLTRSMGATLASPPGYPDTSRTCVACGGAHTIAMKVV